MRTIKYRGKCILNGEWCYGSLIITNNNTNNPFARNIPKSLYQILQYEAGDWNMGGWANYDVNKDTVGQFTGLHDNEGTDIYEADILHTREEGDGENSARTDTYYIVSFNEKDAVFQARQITAIGESCWYHLLSEIHYYQVIGNIHDNPEILNSIK